MLEVRGAVEKNLVCRLFKQSVPRADLADNFGLGNDAFPRSRDHRTS